MLERHTPVQLKSEYPSGSEPYKILCFFDKKWLTIFDKVLTPFWKKFLWLKQLLFDAKIWFKDYHLSVFQKIR